MNPAPAATTFWDLIEQLLLTTPRSGHAQRQRAAAGGCRGRVLPSLADRHDCRSENNLSAALSQSPGNRPQANTQKSERDQQRRLSISKLVNGEEMIIVKNKKSQKYNLLKLKSSKTEVCETEDSTDDTNVQNAEHNTDMADETDAKFDDKDETDDHIEKPHVNNPVTDQSRLSKSECIVNDLDIEYVKPKKIPSSERLWRFALKNRKQKSERVDTPKPNVEMPSIRSNEAIYRALKQRLQQALSEKAKNKDEDEDNMSRKPLSKSANRTSASKVSTKASSLQSKKTNKGIKKIKSMSHFPVNASKPLRRVQTEAGSPWVYGGSHVDEDTRQTNNRTREEIDSNKELYNCIIKRRLYCGNQLDMLNKELVGKRSNARSVINKDTARKYSELKNEYLHLCYQESALRHEIALLHAEICMMQNKGFHKVPASIKTITLDTKMSKLQPKHAGAPESPSAPHEHTEKPDTSLFPKLKAPRPLIVPQQRKSFENFCDRFDYKIKRKGKKESDDSRASSHSDIDTTLPSVLDGPTPHGVCSLYTLSPTFHPSPPKREPVTLQEKKSDESLGKLSHRLPKMTSPTCYTGHKSPRLQIDIRIET